MKRNVRNAFWIRPAILKRKYTERGSSRMRATNPYRIALSIGKYQTKSTSTKIRAAKTPMEARSTTPSRVLNWTFFFLRIDTTLRALDVRAKCPANFALRKCPLVAIPVNFCFRPAFLSTNLLHAHGHSLCLRRAFYSSRHGYRH